MQFTIKNMPPEMAKNVGILQTFLENELCDIQMFANENINICVSNTESNVFDVNLKGKIVNFRVYNNELQVKLVDSFVTVENYNANSLFFWNAMLF